VVWCIYWFYDDRRILAEHYENLTRLIDFFQGTARDYILSYGLGDHMEPQPDGSCSFCPLHTPVALTSTAHFYHDTRIVAQAAEILGKDEDAKRYSSLAERIKEAFNQEFLDEATNQYGTGSQTSNAIPLYFGMVPPERIDAVVGNLVDDIVTSHNGHLSTGLLGTNALTWALPEHGAADVMYRIATQTTFPGWGYMVSKGATTIWEPWSGNPEDQLSTNMKMLGSVAKFFYKDLAGISPAGPGYRHIAIKPHIVGDLESARASIRMVRGLATVNWRKGERSIHMEVTIPVNTTAKVSVPTLAWKDFTVSESGKLVWQAGEFIKGVSGIADGRRIESYVTFDVGSGTYSFILRGASE
jgi:alpha-L-rhamnosidase